MYYLTPSFFSSSHIVIKRTNSCKKEEKLDIKWGEMKDTSTWTFIKTVYMVYLKSK